MQSISSQRLLQFDNHLKEEDDDDDTTENNVASVILSNVFLFLLIFGMSATVDIRNMRHQLTNRFALGCGVLMQFIIMPLLGYISVVALRRSGLSEAMGITLLVVTSSPGGSYSNWWCSVFNAELALSVAMTTVSSILSVGLLPGNLMFYSFLAYGTGEDESVVAALDFNALFISLGIVLSAILSGLMASYYYDSPNFHKMANRFGSLSGILLILFSLFLSSGGEGSDSKFWNQPWAFYVAVGSPCVIGLLSANLLSPIAIECCYQNTGIATSMAITMFTDPEERAQAVAVPLFYGFVEAVAIGIYCIVAWKMGWTKAPADENLCVIMTKTYEVVEEESSSDRVEIRNEEGDTEEAMTTTTESHATVVPLQTRPRSSSSFWSWLFSRKRILVRKQQSTAIITEKQVNDENKLMVETATVTEGDTQQQQQQQRNRLTSLDNTADTSRCSTPSTSTPQQTSHQRLPNFSIHSLTIIESPNT